MSTTGLTIRQYEANGRQVIEPTGEITVMNIHPFRSIIAGLQGSSTDAVIDLRKVCYIDSAGIEQLVVAYQLLQKVGRKLIVLVKPDTQPEHVLEAIAIHTFASMTTKPEELGLEEE